MNRAKLAIARTFQTTGLSRGLLALQRAALRPHARALNYHDVPRDLAPSFEAQLQFYARHFVSMGYADLLALHAGQWPHAKPGLMLTFDDGLRSHAEVVAPLLEEYGMTGWFMVPVAVLGDSQATSAPKHTVVGPTLSWPALLRLRERHVIGCHTFSHCRLGSALTPDDLATEIFEAKRLLEEGLGCEIPVFAWVGGEEWSYSAAAAEAIRRAGFRVSFMTNSAPIRPGSDLLQLQRTNVEASDPPALLHLSLSGFFDAWFAAKRRRVNRLTAAPSA
jgi:peptidoglycan/xylan/chitin deacetylase (PgdA/CDA1 family)